MKPGSWNYVIITDYLSACQIIRDYFEAGKMWKGTECRIFAAGGRAYRLLVLLKKEEEKRKKEEPSGFSSSQKKKKKKKGRAYCRLLILSNPPAVQDCLCKASRMEQKIYFLAGSPRKQQIRFCSLFKKFSKISLSCCVFRVCPWVQWRRKYFR